MSDFLASVRARRRAIYRLDDAPCLRTAGEAQAFINQVGFCLLFPTAHIELPDLWSLSEGRPWRWKDQLPIQKQVYYGRRFRGRAGFVSLDVLPALYALTPTAEFDGDRFELYRRDFISQAAMRITGILQAQGPLTTRELRRVMGMAAQHRRFRFSRMLAEAERKFLIVKSDVASTDYARYTYVWDTFARFWPEIAARGRQISHEEAGLLIIRRYLYTVVAATARQIASTFTLNHEFVEYYANRLLESGDIEGIDLAQDERWYVMPAAPSTS